MGCDTSKELSQVALSEFQSTHPHGVRQSDEQMYNLAVEFQSTHPHGVRRTEVVTPPEVRSFNPRTRMGCDSKI